MVADAGMVSEANKRAIEAAGLSFIIGARIPHEPSVITQRRAQHPGADLPDGHVFTQPWPAGSTDKRRDHTFYYQYRTGRAAGTGAPCAGSTSRSPRPRKSVAGTAAVKRNRFVTLTGGTRNVNRRLEVRPALTASVPINQACGCSRSSPPRRSPRSHHPRACAIGGRAPLQLCGQPPRRATPAGVSAGPVQEKSSWG